jgi:hypothetical protein
MMLLVSILYSVDGRMIIECGAVGGMRTGRANRVLESPPEFYFVPHKSRIT